MNTNPGGVAAIWKSLSAHTAFESQAPATLEPRTSERPVNTEPVIAYPQHNYYLPGFNDTQPVDDNIWKPLTPYSNYGAEPGISSSALPDEAAATTSGDAVEADSWDPNTYLYSYMRDNDASPAAVTSYPRDNSNIWVPSASYRNNAYKTAAPTLTAKNNSTTNIWKPGNTFTDRRRNTESGPSYYSAGDTQHSTAERSSGSAVRKFDWSQTSPWN
jgi:hypothetical protein